MSSLVQYNEDDDFSIEDFEIEKPSITNESKRFNDLKSRRLSNYYQPDTLTNDPDFLTTNPKKENISQFRSVSHTQKNKTPMFKSFPRKHTATFRTLQKWEGMVEEVFEDYFSARVVDKTTSNLEEYVEFDLEDIDDDDRALLEPGAIFYWSIGYYKSVQGQRLRSSQIRFRRLPAWTESDLQKVNDKADEIMSFFNLDT